MNDSYYAKVGTYYDNDAENFEKRYGANPLLKKIRESFREESNQQVGHTILEIGYGPGFDIVYFAQTYPKSVIYGIDISEEMMRLAINNCAEHKLSNVHLSTGSIEDVQHKFEGVKFDFIYVYFGALNTVKDLNTAALILEKLLAPNGKMTLTIINKYYLALIAKNLFHLRFKAAFARLNKIWGGYSPYRHLDSKCYSFNEIKSNFSNFRLTGKRGYSIAFPAWYEHKKFETKPNLLQRLWNLDLILNKTIFWQCGEYALYHFERKND